ncbi:hypothetical protein [Chitinilyticum litopenaei]|uniref:hypothetical protein n=1 Tax=Chitinilyticum litopenaei TaxID=1121276 RepID=UPI0004158BC2|nr:hypothetical protein [Chitinilyticum litopenaei]
MTSDELFIITAPSGIRAVRSLVRFARLAPEKPAGLLKKQAIQQRRCANFCTATAETPTTQAEIQA